VDATVGVDADVDLDAEWNVAAVTSGENRVEHETDTRCVAVSGCWDADGPVDVAERER
jgi:hypothetical protein